ncbi:MAG: hypothetical protein H6718_21065 [Polyangiaceae bacterium]|nr:hypothetical protein [Polyangiaceae bacterium]
MVWFSTETPEGRAAMHEVRDAVVVQLHSLDKEVLEAVDSLAAQYPVFADVAYRFGRRDFSAATTLRHVVGLRFLTELHFPDFAQFTRLRWLEMEPNTDERVPLETLPTSLEHLALWELDEASLPAILRLENLRSLSYHVGPKSPSPESFAPLRQLEELSIRSEPYESVGGFAHLPHLQKLSLVGGHLNGETVKTVSEARGLLDLELIADINYADMAPLATLRQLERLHYVAAGSGNGDDAMGAIAKLPRLQELLLEQAPLSDRGLKLLTQLPLKRLSLESASIDDRNAQTLSQFTGLESLSLQWTPVSNVTLRQLPTTLRELNLWGTQVTQADLPLLTRFPELSELDLTFMEIDDAHLEALTALPELRRLNVMSPLLTPASEATLERMPKLAVLISSNALDCATIRIERFSCRGSLGR